ncbi:ESX secretion-associated protein EspG [Pseudonocardia spinosispora]|uniref:ESX secretion-associated protein EspG n=1 Tax=Pseudonocardia spinosispora TaxID=103441 RepID=UPI000429E964|nr:ESX secretion-associated protein EspG [Pseudonocardia spinosispora]
MDINWPAAVQLEPVEFLACWEALTLGEPPFLLRMRHPDGTVDQIEETRRQFTEAIAGLAERGLSDGVHPGQRLAQLLGVLSRSDYQIDIRFTGPYGRPVLGLGGIAGGDGVIAVSNDGLGPITLLEMDSSRVAASLLSLPGPMTPGVGPQVNIPVDLLDKAIAATTDNSFWTLADRLRELGVPAQDANALARMSSATTFGGQLGATARFGAPERRGPWVIAFHSAGEGYFMMLRRGTTVTMGPTDANRLLLQWRELVENLQ